MYQDISLKEMLDNQKNQQLTLIDVRSPSEFKQGTIPGSINIPVFSDEERAEVGTIYKQVSSQAARERGLEIMSAKLPDFVKKFSEINQEKVVFCWRGGMRSKAAATVVDLMDISVYRLEGGIRAYRSWVVDTLATFEMKPVTYELNGYTGSGKTAILHQLAHEGYPVIDLERMAGHRGSIFGQIGLEPNNQRTFDSLLLTNLLKLQASPFVFVEAESRRIGKVLLPDFLLDKKEQGIQIFIDMPIDVRVQNILDDYQPWSHHEQHMEAFSIIKKRIHTPIATEIEQHLHAGEYELAVQLLLEYYYDPRYQYTMDQFPEERTYYVKARNIDEAVNSIKKLVSTMAVY